MLLFNNRRPPSPVIIARSRSQPRQSKLTSSGVALGRGFPRSVCKLDDPVFKHDRNRLDATSQLTGPAIVESLDSTLVIPPGWSASNDHRGFITMERHHNE